MKKVPNSCKLATTIAIASIFLAAQANAAALTIEPIATTGQLAGDTGRNFTSFGSVDVNDLGQIVFRAATTPDGAGNDAGVFLFDGGATQAVVLEGDTAGVPGQVFASVGGANLNNLGQVTFSAFVAPGDGFGNNSGSFIVNGAGVPSELFFEGDAAGATGETLTGFNSLSLNNLGQVAFSSFTTHDANGNNSGVFVADVAGGVSAVAFEGEAAGDVGETFEAFFAADLNDFGETAFVAQTIDTPEGYDRGVFLGNGAGVSVIAFEGDTVDDTGLTFSTFSPVPWLSHNNAGATAFFAATTPDAEGDNSGIFLSDGAGTITTLAFEGDVISGLGEEIIDFAVGPSLDETGRVAFGAFTTADADGNNSGIFLNDNSGDLVKILFEGDQIVDALGLTRTIASIDMLEEILSLSTAGVAFKANYTDGGEGVFFASFDDLSEVPLPAALPLMVLGLGGVQLASRRRRP